jgi:phage-related protein
MYRVTFYSAMGKASPVTKFLDNCNESLRAKILRQLKYVQEFGLSPVVPNLRKLTKTPFWELRILGKDNVRIICVNYGKREIKIIHVFKKKKRKTPEKEIKMALRRYSELTNDIQ